MGDLPILITRQILESGVTSMLGQDIDYPLSRLGDRDINGICRFREYDMFEDEDVLHEECDSLSVPVLWTDNDGNTGESGQETFLGQETFYFDGGQAIAGHFAQRDATIGAVFGRRTTIEIKLYHSELGDYQGGVSNDQFELEVDLTNNQNFNVYWATDGLWIYNGAWIEVLTDIVSTLRWDIWRFVIDHSLPEISKVDIYKNRILVASGFDCTNVVAGGFTEGNIKLKQWGENVPDTRTNMDYLFIKNDSVPGLIRVDVDQSSDELPVDTAIIERQNWGNPNRASWTFGDECEDIDFWTDLDTNAGGGAGAASTQTIFKGEEVFKMLGNTTAGAGTFARRRFELGDVFATQTTLQFRVYHDLLDTYLTINYFGIDVGLSATLRINLAFCGCGLWINSGVYSRVNNDEDLVDQDIWTIWRFEINHAVEANATMNIYKDDVLIASGVDCSSVGATTAGRIDITQYGSTIDETLTYVDYLYFDNHLSTGQPVQIQYFRNLPGLLLDEDCADISDWVDGDINAGGGAGAESSQATFDGEETFRFLGSTTPGAGTYARRYRNLGNVFGSVRTRATFEFELYHAQIGTSANSDYFDFGVYLSSSLLLSLRFCSDELKVSQGAPVWWTDFANAVEQDTSTIWRLVVDWSGGEANATVTIYKNNELFAKNVDCSYTGAAWTEGQISFAQRGDTTAYNLSYLNWVKIDGELVEWTNAVTPFLQEDNERIHKTWADVTAPLWKVEAGILPGLLMNENCVSFTDPYTWTDQDTANAISTEEIGVPGTYDRVFQFTVNPAGGGEYARRRTELGDIFSTQTTLETELYHALLGTRANNDNFDLTLYLRDMNFNFQFGTDGLFANIGAPGWWVEVGTNLVRQGIWQKWRFVISHEIQHEATVDVYLDDVLQAAGVDCSSALPLAPGSLLLTQEGGTTNNVLTYVRSLKIDSGLIAPFQTLAGPQAAEITLGLEALTLEPLWPGSRDFGHEPRFSELLTPTGHRWASEKGDERWFKSYVLPKLSTTQFATLEACLAEIGWFKNHYLIDENDVLRHVQLINVPTSLSYKTASYYETVFSFMEVL